MGYDTMIFNGIHNGIHINPHPMEIIGRCCNPPRWLLTFSHWQLQFFVGFCHRESICSGYRLIKRWRWRCCAAELTSVGIFLLQAAAADGCRHRVLIEMFPPNKKETFWRSCWVIPQLMFWVISAMVKSNPTPCMHPRTDVATRKGRYIPEQPTGSNLITMYVYIYIYMCMYKIRICIYIYTL